MAIFEVPINEQYTLKGYNWPVDSPKAFIVAITGMDEYAERYDDFCKILNEHGYSVFFFDHFGQGRNAESAEKQEIWPKNAWDMTLKALHRKVTEDERAEHAEGVAEHVGRVERGELEHVDDELHEQQLQNERDGTLPLDEQEVEVFVERIG